MLKGWILFFLLQSIECSYTQPSKGSNYTINSTNIIVNSLISKPVISPQPYYNYVGKVEGWTTKVKFVEVVDCCGLFYTGNCNYKGITCGTQLIDTDSVRSNEQYYQNISLTAGRYFKLSFDWISEIPWDINSTGLSVIWNNITITTFYDNTCILKSSTFYLSSIEGINQIVFQGMGKMDSQGILIRNVTLQQLIYPPLPPPIITIDTLPLYVNTTQFTTIFNVFGFIRNNSILKILNLLSSKRNVIFLMGYILDFNHLILYNYHKNNYTLTSNVILVCVLAFYQQKGYLLDQYIYPMLKINSSYFIADFNKQNNLTLNINSVFPTYIHRKTSVLLEIMDTLLLDLPLTFLLFILGFALFKTLFNYRISLLFRQYSIFGLIFYFLLDGKLQILTFHFLSEMLLLVPSTFYNKLTVILIIYCYFICLIFAVGSMIVYHYQYHKLLKYVYDNCKKPLSSTLYMTFSYGVYNIILGFLHRLLIAYPQPQLYILISFETLYLIYISSLLFRNFYQNILLALTLCLMNTSRLAFLITFVIYQIKASSFQKISLIQMFIFYFFVAFWICSVLIFIFKKCFTSIQIIKIIINQKNKVSPSLQNDKHDQNKHQHLQSKKSKFEQNSQLKYIRMQGHETHSLKQLLDPQRSQDKKMISKLYQNNKNAKNALHLLKSKKKNMIKVS